VSGGVEPLLDRIIYACKSRLQKCERFARTVKLLRGFFFRFEMNRVIVLLSEAC
jgi:hypothetical protein